MGMFGSLTDRAIGFAQGVVRQILAPAVDQRAQALASNDALYRGQQYEGRGLAASWDKQPPGGRRVPLRLQKPSVQYDLPELIVNRPTSLLYGEGRFPELSFDPDGDATDADAEVATWLAKVADEGNLQAVALLASRQGCAVGSSVITWAVVASDDDDAGDFEFTAHKAQYCTPTFDPKRPTRLVALEKLYQFTRQEQTSGADGVVVTQVVPYWHRETWDTHEHVVYVDQKVVSGRAPTNWQVADTAIHNFGFVPGEWCKAIDDGEPANVDGLSLLDGIADNVEDIDRTLSQKSRAVRYNQEPERVIFGEQPASDATQVGGSQAAPTRIASKDKGGAIELLEITGEGQRIAEEHVVAQAGRTLETKRVVSPDPKTLLAASHSGAALRILHAPTLELVGELRGTFGRALRNLLNQILRAARKGSLGALGVLASPPPAVIPPGRVKLVWGNFFDPTPDDLNSVATTAVALAGAKLVDDETLTRWVAGRFGFKDIDSILERLTTQKADAAAKLAAMPPPVVPPANGAPPPHADTPPVAPPAPGAAKPAAGAP